MQKSNYNTVKYNKTLFQPLEHSQRGKWIIVNAEGKRLGRVASEIAFLALGKKRADYATHYSNSANIIVLNASKVVFSGNKINTKKYFDHPTTRPGQKVTTLRSLFHKNPVVVLKRSIRGMLPKNALGYELMRRIRIFAGAQHLHHAQVDTNEKD